jgi:hypothetical protein
MEVLTGVIGFPGAVNVYSPAKFTPQAVHVIATGYIWDGRPYVILRLAVIRMTWV